MAKSILVQVRKRRKVTVLKTKQDFVAFLKKSIFKCRQWGLILSNWMFSSAVFTKQSWPQNIIKLFYVTIQSVYWKIILGLVLIFVGFEKFRRLMRSVFYPSVPLWAGAFPQEVNFYVLTFFVWVSVGESLTNENSLS